MLLTFVRTVAFIFGHHLSRLLATPKLSSLMNVHNALYTTQLIEYVYLILNSDWYANHSPAQIFFRHFLSLSGSAKLIKSITS